MIDFDKYALLSVIIRRIWLVNGGTLNNPFNEVCEFKKDVDVKRANLSGEKGSMELRIIMPPICSVFHLYSEFEFSIW